MNAVTESGAANRPFSHPLFDRMFSEFGFTQVPQEGFEQFRKHPGHTLLFFSADPVRYRETLDLAVVLPEISRAFPGRFAVGVLLPEAAGAIAPRYGVRRWPALVLLRDGEYVGAIDGIRDWNGYRAEMEKLLEALPTRPPTVGVAVEATGAGGMCH